MMIFHSYVKLLGGKVFFIVFHMVAWIQTSIYGMRFKFAGLVIVLECSTYCGPEQSQKRSRGSDSHNIQSDSATCHA